MAEPTIKQDYRASPLKRKSPQESTLISNVPSPERAMDVAAQNSDATSPATQNVPNGVAQIDHVKPPANDTPPLKRLPPEIEHITQGFQPLAKLFGRVSQDCFNSLNDLITELANIGGAPQVNGASAGTTSATTPEASVARRIRWLKWAHGQRQKFIQLLVILLWSQKAPEVSRLIDVNWWINTQDFAITKAWEDFGMVKRGASSTVLPGPNILKALDILREHEQSTLSSLDYIPPVPLTASRILGTIRNLDVLLHIRLNLHEDLPQYLQDYRIHDGKVTFKVSGEFEVDLIIADEDPSSQFWFVDFRLLFSSVSEVPSNSLMTSMENRVNNALATWGLWGCFDVLHEFCLTLKISMLRQQAIALNRAAWAGHLKVDQHNRSLVIQYWCGRPAKKSWLQIGVRRGKATRAQAGDGYWPSELTFKWVCGGKLAQLPFDLDLGNCTAEAILKCVISQHISAILLNIKLSLDQSTRLLSSSTSPVLLKSDTEPSECALRLSLRSRRSASILVEPMSGRLVLQPATPSAAHFESELNALDFSGVHWVSRIEHWLARESVARIRWDLRSALYAIEQPPGATRDSVKKMFGNDTIEVIFARRKTWRSSDWYIAFAAHPTHESAWVVRMALNSRLLQMNELHALDGLHLQSVMKQGPDWAEKLEQLAVARITREALNRGLNQKGTNPAIQQGTVASASGTSSVSFDIGSLLPEADMPGSGSSAIMNNRRVLLILVGFQESTTGDPMLKFIVKGRINKSIAQSGTLSSIEGGSFTFAPDGLFSFTVESQLGSSEPIEAVISRITALEQLGMALKTLRQHQLPCQSARLDGLTFKYSGDDSLARVAFTRNGSLHVDQLAPTTASQPLLLQRLNSLFRSQSSSSSNTFSILLRTLIFTMPLLRALDAITASDLPSARARSFVHSLASFSLVYMPFAVRVSITFTAHRGEAYWTMQLRNYPQPQGILNMEHAKKFVDGVRRLWIRSGDGWSGTKNGIICKPESAPVVLGRIDEIATEALGKAPRIVNTNGTASGGQQPGGLSGKLTQQGANAQGQIAQQQQQDNRIAQKQNKGNASGSEIVVID